MRCKKCGFKIKDDWNYCPFCGAKGGEESIFDSIFSRFKKELEEMDKMFERDFEAFDISPFFSKPKSRGFSIKIISSGHDPPKVSIKTYGDINGERLEKELKNQLGIGGLEKTKDKKRGLVRIPKTTEEPKTEIRRVGAKVVVEMDIPGVKNENDIEIRELENSVEVKAMANDKAFFKILTKPPQTTLTGKRFKNGKLFLEFS